MGLRRAGRAAVVAVVLCGAGLPCLARTAERAGDEPDLAVLPAMPAPTSDAPAVDVPAVLPALAPAPDLPLAPRVPDRFEDWVLASRDHAGLPFAVVDKQAATLTVYRADGRRAGSTAVLIGLTPGDTIAPGTGARTQQGRLAAGDRTTPAGRFPSEPGRNLSGEDIVWLDYGAAFAIHRLRPGPSHERRAERLASPTPRDNRASAGCVVVPVAFYDAVVRPELGRGRGIVYVLPEQGWAGPAAAGHLAGL